MKTVSRNWQLDVLLGAGAAEHRDEIPLSCALARGLGSSRGAELRPWTHRGWWPFLPFRSMEVLGRAAGTPRKPWVFLLCHDFAQRGCTMGLGHRQEQGQTSLSCGGAGWWDPHFSATLGSHDSQTRFLATFHPLLTIF